MSNIQYGVSLASNSPLVIDRFILQTPHACLFGASGCGKTYLAKLEAIRLVDAGIPVTVIDPEDEWRNVDGVESIVLGPTSADRLNPLDFSANSDDDALGRHIHALVAWLGLASNPGGVGYGFDAYTAQTVVDALRGVYADFGYTEDPATQTSASPERMPLLSDLRTRLSQDGADGLAKALSVYCTGGPYAGIFDVHTNRTIGDGLCVVSMLGLSAGGNGHLLRMGMHLALMHFNDRFGSRREHQRVLTIENADILLGQPESAAALDDSVRRLRKFDVGVTVSSLASLERWTEHPIGARVVGNCSTILCLRQPSQSAASATFLDPAARTELPTFTHGQGYAVVGSETTRFTAVGIASEDEHRRITITEAEHVRFKAEATRWIDEHGSPSLVDGVARGFNMHSQYLDERAVAEFPGYLVERSDCEIRKRVSPSPAGIAALEAAYAKVIEDGRRYRVSLGWYAGTRAQQGRAPVEGEVVVIHDWLGRYRLVQETGPVEISRQLEQFSALLRVYSVKKIAEVMSGVDHATVAERWKRAVDALEGGASLEDALGIPFPAPLPTLIIDSVDEGTITAAIEYWRARIVV